MTDDDIFIALKNAYKRAGTQHALSKIAGISQSTIADYLNARYSIGNMTVSTLLKLFPELKMYFFRDEYPAGAGNTISSVGRVNGPITQGSGNTVTSNIGGTAASDPATKMLLDYWDTLSQVKKFEVLAKVAEMTEGNGK